MGCIGDGSFTLGRGRYAEHLQSAVFISALDLTLKMEKKGKEKKSSSGGCTKCSPLPQSFKTN